MICRFLWKIQDYFHIYRCSFCFTRCYFSIYPLPPLHPHCSYLYPSLFLHLSVLWEQGKLDLREASVGELERWSTLSMTQQTNSITLFLRKMIIYFPQASGLYCSFNISLCLCPLFSFCLKGQFSTNSLT